MSGDLFSFFAAPPSLQSLSTTTTPLSTSQPAEGKRGRPVPFLVYDDEGGDPRRITPRGRDAWALAELLAAGAAGCTPIERVGPRWSHYVFKLRTVYCLNIETITEPHGGEFKGTHARYVLRSRVAFADPGDATGFAEGGR